MVVQLREEPFHPLLFGKAKLESGALFDKYENKFRKFEKLFEKRHLKYVSFDTFKRAKYANEKNVLRFSVSLIYILLVYV